MLTDECAAEKSRGKQRVLIERESKRRGVRPKCVVGHDRRGDEIAKLQESDFPYPHSREALNLLEGEYNTHLTKLSALPAGKDPAIAAGPDGVYLIWTAGPAIHALLPGKSQPITLAEQGAAAPRLPLDPGGLPRAWQDLPWGLR